VAYQYLASIPSPPPHWHTRTAIVGQFVKLEVM